MRIVGGVLVGLVLVYLFGGRVWRRLVLYRVRRVLPIAAVGEVPLPDDVLRCINSVLPPAGQRPKIIEPWPPTVRGGHVYRAGPR